MTCELNRAARNSGGRSLLTVVGRNLDDGATVTSTHARVVHTDLTPSTAGCDEQQGAQLVPGRADGTPRRACIRSASKLPTGISNILLFSVGAFPETVEEESRPYSRANRNDTIEKAEPVQQCPSRERNAEGR